MSEYYLLIGGDHVRGTREIDVVNPATGEAFAKCPVADIAQLNLAVSSAKTAFPAWSALEVKAGAALIHKLATIVNVAPELT